MFTNETIYILFDENKNFRGVFKTIDSIINYLEIYKYDNFEMTIDKHALGDIPIVYFKHDKMSHYAIITTVN